MAARKGSSVATPASYLRLVRQFPLRPVRSDEELERAIEVVNQLLDRDKLDLAEQDYLDVLGDLIERYESEAHPIEDVSPADVLAHLLEARGVTAAVAARACGIAVTAFSDFLEGKKVPSAAQAQKLARYFQIDADLFTAD
jgi:HTH-type transcriptional regulator/antitoxin HigA